MKENVDYQAYVKVIRMLHSITKMDIRLSDEDGGVIFQFVNHAVPVVLQTDHGFIVPIHEVLKKNDPDHYYHYVDPFGMEYIAAGIWKNPSFSGSILIGPMISSLPVIDLIKDIISNHNLPVGERRTLEDFYQSLPVLSNDEFNDIGELLIHLRNHHHIHYQPIASETPMPTSNHHPKKRFLDENKHAIEKRYEYQNRLMDAITKGDKIKVKNQIDHLMPELVEFSTRVPESPIRSSKNIGFVLNTMCRIATEKSGVHPVYLHNISERFAILIERTNTVPKLKKLFLLMADEYCDLVTTVSTGQYSPIVKKAMDYILLNLGNPLPLEHIADHIPINPSHLSRKFKEDTGMTITEFINHKRVDEAKLYLQRGNISVTDVAFMVGFNDLNYFSKVFKKIVSETPSQYAKRRH